MALLDRLKARFETDVADAELQRIIDEGNAEIIQRYGPHADDVDTLTEVLDGKTAHIFPSRWVDEVVSLSETVTDTETVLVADDYRLEAGGRLVRRLDSGTNARSSWGDTATLVYRPVDDGNQRQEVILKLAILTLQYQGVKSERVGDYQMSAADYAKEREELLRSLRRGRRFA